MSQKRFDQVLENEHERNGNDLVLAEVARGAAESSVHKTAPKGDEEHMSLFWRVFGGTLLSMVAIGIFTLYNNIASNIAELRSELSREREARSELVKKDEFNSRSSSQYERIRSFEVMKAEQEGMKERVNANAATLDSLKKDTVQNVEGIKKDIAAAIDAAKKDGAAIEVLKEKLLSLESLRKDVIGVEVVKEKLASAAGDLKLLREELGKMQQEQDRNRVADLERKGSRDAQYRLTEDTLKELQKGLQDCREKLARLEGTRGMGNPTDRPSPKEPGTSAGTGKPSTGEKSEGM